MTLPPTGSAGVGVGAGVGGKVGVSTGALADTHQGASRYADANGHGDNTLDVDGNVVDR
ncbi:MAG: hypothetical protein ACOYNY_43125 [Caldilineaceae bacterium]